MVVALRDTTEAAREVHVAVLRRLGGAGRLEQALRMSEEARRISIAGMLSRHPGMSAEEARFCVLRRVIGADLYEAAYGRKPE